MSKRDWMDDYEDFEFPDDELFDIEGIERELEPDDDDDYGDFVVVIKDLS